MNSIIQNYNLLVKKYQKIEEDLTENQIHDKRVILRRIFPILAACKIKPSKVKNGEEAFELFGKLRDIQVQLLKLESIEHTPDIVEYLAYLKERELKLKERVSKFCKKKKLIFPTIKKGKVEKERIYKKFDKSFYKLIDSLLIESIDDAEDIHNIRIEFKKFRYIVEVLSYIDEIDEAKLEKLKMHQDKLGEIQDYEVLIRGIKKFCRKKDPGEEANTEVFEIDQNTLIECFENDISLFIEDCKDVILLKRAQN